MDANERLQAERELRQAETDLSDIRALKLFPAFERYMLRRMNQKRDEKGKEILSGKFPEGQVGRELSAHAAFCDLCAMLESDERAARNIIENSKLNQG